MVQKLVDHGPVEEAGKLIVRREVLDLALGLFRSSFPIKVLKREGNVFGQTRKQLDHLKVLVSPERKSNTTTAAFIKGKLPPDFVPPPLASACQ